MTMGWQSMDTCPRRGQVLLHLGGCDCGCGHLWITSAWRDLDRGMGWGTWSNIIAAPKAWMPLPGTANGEHRVGEFVADYTMPTQEQIQAPIPEVDDLLKNSRIVDGELNAKRETPPNHKLLR